MSKLFLSAVISCAALLLTACTKKEQPTVVKGVVVNRYTRQPVADLPIVIHHRTSGGWFGGSGTIDSVTAQRTDAAGQYSISFSAQAIGEYEVRTDPRADLYNLTTGSEGWFEAKAGVVNDFSPEVTPFKKVTVHADCSKGGRSIIEFYMLTNDNLGDFGSNFFLDTLKINQHVSFNLTVKALPNRSYRFWKSTYNLVKQSNGTYKQQDFTYEQQIRTVFYNDTTAINWR